PPECSPTAPQPSSLGHDKIVGVPDSHDKAVPLARARRLADAPGNVHFCLNSRDLRSVVSLRGGAPLAVSRDYSRRSSPQSLRSDRHACPDPGGAELVSSRRWCVINSAGAAARRAIIRGIVVTAAAVSIPAMAFATPSTTYWAPSVATCQAAGVP